MTRYRTYGKLDDPHREVGDIAFAFSSRDEPNRLKAGMVSDAVNVRMDDGKVTTRLGHKTQMDLTTGYLTNEKQEVLTAENGDGLLQEVAELTEIYNADFFAGIGSQDRNQILSSFKKIRSCFWNGKNTTEKKYKTIYVFDPFLPVYLRFFLTDGEGDFAFTLASTIETVQYNNHLILLNGVESTLPVHLDFLLEQPVQKWNGDLNSEFVVDENIPMEILVLWLVIV